MDADGIDGDGISVLDWLKDPDAAAAALQRLSPSPQLPLHPLLEQCWKRWPAGAPLISNIGSPIAADLGQHDRERPA